MAHAHDIAALNKAAEQRLKWALEQLIRRLEAYLAEQLKAAELDEDGKLKTGAHNAELTAKLGRSFAQIIRDLGWDATVADVLDDFEELVDANEAHLTNDLGASFTSGSLEQLVAFVDGTLDDMTVLNGAAADKMREVLLLGVSTNLPLERVIEEVAAAAGSTLGEARIVASTALMAFHREMLVSESEEAGFDLFSYDGPDDAVNRPFCAEHVGKIYTSGDIDAEDNGHGLRPTSRYCGGYRCRHSLSPITLEEARSLPAELIGGPEARRIVLGGGVGPNEEAFIERNRGQVRRGRVVRAA